jgi:hypothetical protein
MSKIAVKMEIKLLEAECLNADYLDALNEAGLDDALIGFSLDEGLKYDVGFIYIDLERIGESLGKIVCEVTDQIMEATNKVKEPYRDMEIKFGYEKVK